jgi:hypothetical protein
MTREDIEKNIDNILISKESLIKIKKAGFPIPEKPSQCENLFNEWNTLKLKYGGISNIPYSELGEYLDKWASVISYTRWVEANSDIICSNSREIKDMVKKQLYTLQDGSREMKDALVYCDELYIKWENKYLEDLSLYTMLKALREGYEQRMIAISREITRRGDDFKDSVKN